LIFGVAIVSSKGERPGEDEPPPAHPHRYYAV
jgi:hypothetical protein